MTPEQALTEISIELTPRPEDQSCVEAIRALKDQVRVLENRLQSKVGIESRVAELERIGKSVPLIHDGDPHGHCHFDCRACAFTRILNPVMPNPKFKEPV